MVIKPWIKIGDPEILAVGYGGKRFLWQKYQDPQTGEETKFNLLEYKKVTVIVFPLTTTNQVVAIRQFRRGADAIALELPGGTPDPDEENILPEVVGKRELLEETGYTTNTLIQLSSRSIWFEPNTLTGVYLPLFALNCIKTRKQKLDPKEQIAVELFDLDTWVTKILDGTIADSKTITTTFLALGYLKKISA